MSTAATKQEKRRKQRYHLEIQQSIENLLNKLLQRTRSLVDAAPKLNTTKLSNLNNVASETSSAEVVIGYVQYQVGRGVWPRRFGDALITDLKDLINAAEGIVNQVWKVHHPKNLQKDAELDRVWMLLIRQFVGHLRRYAVYKWGEGA